MTEQPEQPPKPAIEDMPPEEGLDADEFDEDPVSEQEFMNADEATEDETVDDEEAEEQPHSDLPEGARTADYEPEAGDVAKEVAEGDSEETKPDIL